jgi:hypothetical protein
MQKHGFVYAKLGHTFRLQKIHTCIHTYIHTNKHTHEHHDNEFLFVALICTHMTRWEFRTRNPKNPSP